MAGIETAQHVKLNYEIAGVGERVLAYLLDGFFIGVYYFVLAAVSVSLGEYLGDDILDKQWIVIAVIVIPITLYHLLMEVFWKGYSIGKRIVGIRVAKIDGTRADLSGYLLRWIFRLVEITMVGGVLAFVTILVNGKGQRLGDIVAKTCVIKDRKKVKLDETLFAELDEDYEPVYEQVRELGDKDISVIRKVLSSRSKYDHDTWFLMLQRTAKLIEEKADISRGDMNALSFLETVISDYNALHGE
ncbi:RDD family protein [Balneola sp. MJW-20]|uniref:RDD family protein n=1 Tax=Gracilimonas aurantiaca TaxID=3234185 RepID=UPI003467ADD4